MSALPGGCRRLALRRDWEPRFRAFVAGPAGSRSRPRAGAPRARRRDGACGSPRRRARGPRSCCRPPGCTTACTSPRIRPIARAPRGSPRATRCSSSSRPATRATACRRSRHAIEAHSLFRRHRAAHAGGAGGPGRGPAGCARRHRARALHRRRGRARPAGVRTRGSLLQEPGAGRPRRVGRPLLHEAPEARRHDADRRGTTRGGAPHRLPRAFLAQLESEIGP